MSQGHFEERVCSFLSTLVNVEPANAKRLEQEIVRLALQVQEEQGSTRLRRLAFRLGEDCNEKLDYFKKQYLDCSHYIHRVMWIAVVNYVKDSQDHKEDKVSADINYCLKVLEPEDIVKIHKKEIYEELNVDSIDLSTFTTGKRNRKDILAYAKSKASTLKFLTEYDLSMTSEDIEQELLTELVRVFNSYPRSKMKNIEATRSKPIRERIEPYIETSLNNSVRNLKGYHTCENRRRVATTDEALYKKRARLKKELPPSLFARTYKRKKGVLQLPPEVQFYLNMRNDYAEICHKLQNNPNDPVALEEREKLKVWEAPEYKGKETTGLTYFDYIEVDFAIKHSNSDFYSTVSPLVREDNGEVKVLEVGDTNEEYENHGQSLDVFVDSAASMENRLFCEELLLDTPPRISNFVKIILGYTNNEFESWAEKKGVNIGYINSLVKAAREWCGVSKEELKNNRVIKEALSR